VNRAKEPSTEGGSGVEESEPPRQFPEHLVFFEVVTMADSNAMIIMTRMGPVGLREKRKNFQDLQVVDESGKGGKKMTIALGWLEQFQEVKKEKSEKSGEESKEKETDPKEKMYHKAIKQAMIMGARQMDLADAVCKIPDVGEGENISSEELEYLRNLQEKPEKIPEFEKQIELCKTGRQSISIIGHKRTMLKEVLETEDRPRDMLVKYSTRGFCYQKRHRYFLIDNGELVYYKNELPTAKACYPPYNLAQAKVFTEELVVGGRQEPKFESGFELRLRVDFEDRVEAKKNPLYLYPKDKKQLKQWKRSFVLAKQLASENDRRSMRAVIGRCVSALVSKGWEALFWYQKEMKDTRALIQQMSMRLIKVDISRGWTKMKLIWVKDKNEQKRRMEMQSFAARFLSERLARLGTQNETPVAEVRESVVSKIQEKFRAFREEAIFDRRYPITPKHQSRMQQAMAGLVKDVALDALECEDILKLTITDGDAWNEMKNSPDSFITEKRASTTYSECNLLSNARLISVSDNRQALTFAGKIDGIGFVKSDMSNYVNLDRVSQVVMNTSPQLGSQVAYGKGDEGVWCSIYGPRVAWGKRIAFAKDKETQRKANMAVGAKDGFSVPRALGDKDNKTVKLLYAQFTIGVGGAEWDLSDPRKPKKPDEEDEVASTKCHVHILGYRFTSSVANGDSKSFQFPATCLAAVPIAANDEAASAILDQSTVSVEIVQTFTKKTQGQADGKPAETYVKQILVGTDTLGNLFEIGGRFGESKKGDYQKTVTKDIALVTPDTNAMVAKQPGMKNKITVNIAGNIASNQNLQDNRQISPEFFGCGIPTALYTSHRGAWYDTNLTLGRFRMDRVSNFVELKLGSFRFPPSFKGAADESFHSTYRIRAKSAGITAVSPPMHRSKETWQKVLGHFADPRLISFEGIRLCLPLPPGCWGSLPEEGKEGKDAPKKEVARGVAGGRPIVEIEVVKSTPHVIDQQLIAEGKTYETLEKKGTVNPPKDEVVYYSALTFDECLIDETADVSVFLAEKKADSQAIYVNVSPEGDNFLSGPGVPKDGKENFETVLNVEFTLRDRDTVRNTGGKPGKERTLCVGDKALMEVEEPLYYPASKQELNMRKANGRDKWDEKAKEPRDWPGFKKDKKDAGAGKPRGKELRDPAQSAEYNASGLANQIPKVKFRPGIIPAHCQDIFPYKYALPYSENDFIEERRPGVWPYILDDLCDNTAKKADLHAGIPRQQVVTHLKRHIRSVPVTLLAVYPDGTCAVEVAPTFMETWRRQPQRRFNMPGEVVAPQGEGLAAKLTTKNVTPAEKGAPELKRVILQKVPTISLRAVHSVGFHTYDAGFKTLDDYRKAPAPVGDFNPMHVVEESRPVPDSPSRSKSLDDLKNLTKSDQLIIAAGPLPPDASPAACQYEWILHVRSKTVHEMNTFVAMLRQCVRIEHFTAATRLEQALLRQPVEEESPKKSARMVGGQLEVVLVEARRLPPVGVNEAVHKAKEHLEQYSENFETQSMKLSLKGTTSGVVARSTPPGAAINTFVNFRLYSDGKVVPLKGQNVQHSSPMSSTSSPCWASDKVMATQGGFTFRTGHIDPEKLGDAFIEFEVIQETLGTTETIGIVHLGMTKAPCLVDPSQPFMDAWLPLCKKSATKNGNTFIKLKSGEIHVMTRWVTAEQSALGAQMPVKSQLLKELWPKISAPRVKEPVYQIEPQYWHYNPNLVREMEDSTELDPESPPEFSQRHTVELYNAMKYMECLERRQIELWDAFEKRLQDAGHSSLHLGDLKQMWMHRGDNAHHSQLNELIEAGIPSRLREKKWLELAGATRKMYGGMSPEEATEEVLQKTARDSYQRFVSNGVPQNSDANRQLAEDGFHLSGWETAVPAPQDAVDFQLNRIKVAQTVCTALIADQESGVAYCESLLVLAYFLSLPQGCTEKYEEEANPPLDDSSVFWLLHTLINGAYTDYYAKPRGTPKPEGGYTEDALCTGTGAMDDVFLLECCLAYHAPDLWMFLHRIGFQLPTVFYGAFMRLFATYMPTATVFRFWDILITYSQEPHAQPHHRAYLIDLAFGVLRSIKEDIMQCESAYDVRTCILGSFGAIYDMSTVVEITLYAHKFLWGGGGVASAQVMSLFEKRHEIFRRNEEILHGQNEILRHMTRETSIVQTVEAQKGVMTKDVSKIFPGIIETAAQNLPAPVNHLDEGKPFENYLQYWAMHRPMPLVAEYLCEGMVKKTYLMVKEMIRGDEVQPIPRALAPPILTDKERAKLVYPDPDPFLTNATQLRDVTNLHCQHWVGHSEELWLKFNNRIDVEPCVPSTCATREGNTTDLQTWKRIGEEGFSVRRGEIGPTYLD
jgi:hypothetical protein